MHAPEIGSGSGKKNDAGERSGRWQQIENDRQMKDNGTRKQEQSSNAVSTNNRMPFLRKAVAGAGVNDAHYGISCSGESNCAGNDTRLKR
jgi:hypothetical protein